MNSGDSLRGEELVDGGVVGRWKPSPGGEPMGGASELFES